MSIVPDRQVTISRVTAMYLANARAAVERFNREFAAWSGQKGDDVPSPDFFAAAFEFRSYLENILGGIEDGAR
jgi:hypothetical protein